MLQAALRVGLRLLRKVERVKGGMLSWVRGGLVARRRREADASSAVSISQTTTWKVFEKEFAEKDVQVEILALTDSPRLKNLVKTRSLSNVRVLETLTSLLHPNPD